MPGMPDHVGNGEAGPLTQAGPVEPLQARPTEAVLVVHRTLPPNDKLRYKLRCRVQVYKGWHLEIGEERGNKGQFKTKFN